RGIRLYDLGGIDPKANPGVYHFKKGFSGLDITQIAPLCASASVISSAIAGVGAALQKILRAKSLRTMRDPRASTSNN
ncbi:MAG TPA: hypothetical protein VIY53_01925, partial [Acidobacteriaceae bacterium]